MVLVMTSAFTDRWCVFIDSCLRPVIRGLRGFLIVVIGILFALTTSLTFAAEAQALSLSEVPPIDAVTPASSATILFEQNCAGCHVNGGNVIRRGKNLKQKAMKRNGYGEVDAIAQIITNGKGIMSAYGDRLSKEEISAIAEYVHNQSEAGW